MYIEDVKKWQSMTYTEATKLVDLGFIIMIQDGMVVDIVKEKERIRIKEEVYNGW